MGVPRLFSLFSLPKNMTSPDAICFGHILAPLQDCCLRRETQVGLPRRNSDVYVLRVESFVVMLGTTPALKNGLHTALHAKATHKKPWAIAPPLCRYTGTLLLDSHSQSVTHGVILPHSQCGRYRPSLVSDTYFIVQSVTSRGLALFKTPVS